VLSQHIRQRGRKSIHYFSFYIRNLTGIKAGQILTNISLLPCHLVLFGFLPLYMAHLFFTQSIPAWGLFIFLICIYPADMNLLPVLQTGKLIVVYAPHAAREESAMLAAELALRGPVTVLDGGNRFIPYRVAQLLRRKTVDVHAASQRLFIRRAFTCYEMNSLLADTPTLGQPYLILDLLNTFYDDHVPTHEVCRLVKLCLGQLHRLRSSAPVVVTLAPPLVEERAFLITHVCEMADEVLTVDIPVSPITQLTQPALF
jgi:hypothetical protein